MRFNIEKHREEEHLKYSNKLKSMLEWHKKYAWVPLAIEGYVIWLEYYETKLSVDWYNHLLRYKDVKLHRIYFSKRLLGKRATGSNNGYE